MKECAERIIEVGFSRKPKKVVDEMEQVTASMIRNGWRLSESRLEDGLGNVHLFFDRDINPEHTDRK
jgi:hypothetical protein